ncbi:hypothetical protein [Bacillus sp. Marseille-P3800]|uniref:hypothetical protein n=1 Tax=Bacillus sp. Marseille-P3800 TaxID=2014782 RepID=UPI000C0719AA|nr:hypothetical protein [Bacillus sp. Marseille-P3800]
MVRVSEWVHTVHGDRKVTGFITSVTGSEVTIKVTEPRWCNYLTLDRNKIIEADESKYLDDIPVLIDLALWTRDKKWFEDLLYEKSLWRAVEDVL